MAGIPRITDSMLSQQSLRTLQDSLRSVAEQERRISSGQMYSRPSDAPLSVRRLISWDRVVERSVQFEANISFTQSRLGATESALDEMGNIVSRAREIALGQINASATRETRLNASVEISSLIDESVTLSNRQFADRYLFGGSLIEQAPFERTGAYVSYRGDAQEELVEIAVGMRFEASVSGARAFGGFSTELEGQADLDPSVRLDTPLSLLNNGRGVELGSIEIRDGVDRAFVDLRGAHTVGDVVERINASGFATAVLKSDLTGIEISKTGANLTVLDVNGVTTATDLGLAKTSMGTLLIGDDLDPAVAASTRLSDLVAGTGLDDSGFTIRNGNLSADISLVGLETLEELLNAVNSSGTGTVAQLSANGRGIEIFSNLAGADLFIDELGGNTAKALGLNLDVEDLSLQRLHGGRGLLPVDGADFTISLQDGSSFDVDISQADTIGEVVALINEHPANGGNLLAEALSGPPRIRLTDNTTGTENLAVVGVNGSFAANGLGIESSSTTGTLDGDDLAPGGIRLESVFDGFALLYQGLVDNDETTLRRALESLEAAETNVLHTRATVGGRLRRLDISMRRTELETFEFRELMSQEGDTDLAAAAIEFQQHQTIYQAALQTTASLLQQSLLDFLG